jgi:hypothetical protein
MISRTKLLQFVKLALLMPLFCSPAWSTTVSLDMCTLPTTQGWSYIDQYQDIPAPQIFSNSPPPGCVLHEDTSGVGVFAGGFEYETPIDNETFNISMTARVTEDEGTGGPVNTDGHYAISMSIANGTYETAIGIGPGEIDAVVSLADGGSVDLTNQIDTTQFHQYDLVGSFTTGWQLYVDGGLVGGGSFREDNTGLSQIPGVFLGDSAGATHGIGDYSAFSFSTDVPEPSSLLIIAVPLAMLGWRRRNARSGG